MPPNLVVVSVKVEDADEVLAEGEAADAVAALVEHGRVDADPHRVGQHHHHAPRHRRLAGETHLQYRKRRATCHIIIRMSSQTDGCIETC